MKTFQSTHIKINLFPDGRVRWIHREICPVCGSLIRKFGQVVYKNGNPMGNPHCTRFNCEEQSLNVFYMDAKERAEIICYHTEVIEKRLEKHHLI